MILISLGISMMKYESYVISISMYIIDILMTYMIHMIIDIVMILCQTMSVGEMGMQLPDFWP